MDPNSSSSLMCAEICKVQFLRTYLAPCCVRAQFVFANSKIVIFLKYTKKILKSQKKIGLLLFWLTVDLMNISCNDTGIGHAEIEYTPQSMRYISLSL